MVRAGPPDLRGLAGRRARPARLRALEHPGRHRRDRRRRRDPNVHLNVDSDRPSAYIDRLATHKGHRNRGLAQALLVDSFAVGGEHGAVRSELSTDSRTGALTLYERVGMSVTSVWVNRAKDL